MGTKQTLDQVTDHIEHLETKLAFQEHTIEQLNDALTSQQQQLERLQYQMRHVLEKLKSMQEPSLGNNATEPPPPHY